MNLDYSEFLGRIAIGRVFNGTLQRGHRSRASASSMASSFPRASPSSTPFADWSATKRTDVAAGDLVAIAGVEGIQIGESITDLAIPRRSSRC